MLVSAEGAAIAALPGDANQLDFLGIRGSPLSRCRFTTGAVSTAGPFDGAVTASRGGELGPASESDPMSTSPSPMMLLRSRVVRELIVVRVLRVVRIELALLSALRLPSPMLSSHRRPLRVVPLLPLMMDMRSSSISAF